MDMYSFESIVIMHMMILSFDTHVLLIILYGTFVENQTELGKAHY